MRLLSDEEYKEALTKMKDATYCPWHEEAHEDADNVLCSMLRKMGYTEIVDIFNKIDKWYA